MPLPTVSGMSGKNMDGFYVQGYKDVNLKTCKINSLSRKIPRYILSVLLKKGNSCNRDYFSVDHFFECKLNLLVVIQGESIWNGAGGSHS